MSDKDNELIERALELDNSADKGPWIYKTFVKGVSYDVGRELPQLPECEGMTSDLPLMLHAIAKDKEDNAKLIAEYRTLCPQLATRLREVLEENAKLKEKYSPTYHDVEEFYKDE